VPPAAGSEDTFNRVWVGGFGSWARQKNRDQVFGYDFNNGGFSLGYDRRAEGLPGLRFGVVASFSTGDIDSKSGWSSIDVKTAGIGLYGSYTLDNGVFFDANVAYARAENDVEIKTIGPGGKSGEFDIDTWQIGARVGKIFDLGGFTLTPTIGVRYLNIRQEQWAERLNGDPRTALAVRNWFAKKSDHVIEIPVLAKLNTTFEVGQTKITPEVRLGWTFVAQRPDNDLTVGFVGSNLSTTIYGYKESRGSLQVGTGIKIGINDTVDVFVNYDLDASKDYKNHNAAIGVGFNF
jgi:outer membrane autotransporter protein